jgi:hypothetical protein
MHDVVLLGFFAACDAAADPVCRPGKSGPRPSLRHIPSTSRMAVLQQPAAVLVALLCCESEGHHTECTAEVQIQCQGQGAIGYFKHKQTCCTELSPVTSDRCTWAADGQLPLSTIKCRANENPNGMKPRSCCFSGSTAEQLDWVLQIAERFGPDYVIVCHSP